MRLALDGARRKALSRPSALLQIRSMRVLAIGNTIIDTVLTMNTIPVDDKCWIDSKKRFVGGQGANAAQDMALLGLDVSFLTRVGDDEDGDMALKHFKSLGLGTSHCIVVPNAQTMSACVAIATAVQQRACLMHKDEKMFSYNIEADLLKIDMSHFDAMYTDGYQLDLVLPVVKKAADLNLPIMADIEVLDDETRRLANMATLLIAPAKVICTLSGQDDPAAAVLSLANARPGVTVIGTVGNAGSYGAKHGDVVPTHVPAEKCDVRDTVGAGDAFHAGYLAAMARGHRDLSDIMSFASRVAAALCETPGPVVSVESLQRFGLLKR